MNRLAAYLLTAIALLAVGFGTGWHWKGVRVQADQAQASAAAVDHIAESVNQQATAQYQHLQAEQDASVTLFAQQQLTRAGAADIRLEISHAAFTTPPAPPSVAASCPDPVGSPDFARLYDRAAQGLDRPAPSGPTRTR